MVFPPSHYPTFRVVDACSTSVSSILSHWDSRHWEDLHLFPTSPLGPVSLEALEAPASRPSSPPDVHDSTADVEKPLNQPLGIRTDVEVHQPQSSTFLKKMLGGGVCLCYEQFSISTSTPPKLNCTIKKRPWIARWECFSVRWKLEISPRSERRRNFQVHFRVVWSFEGSRPQTFQRKHQRKQERFSQSKTWDSNISPVASGSTANSCRVFLR